MYALKPKLMKRINETLVREALAGRGRASKNDLAADTGLSLTTIGQLLSEMHEAEEIKLCGFNESSGGRKATVYELNPDACAVYAVAVETDHLDWASANALGTLTADGTCLVREDPIAEAAFLVERLKKDALIRRPRKAALAVGVPGAVQDGKIITGLLKDRWIGNDIAAYFLERTGLPVAVENDVNATALGFVRRTEEEGREIHSLVYIVTNGACTGSGIVCGGQVLRGAAHFAGELGFLPNFAGAAFDKALVQASLSADPAAYAATYASALATVNCVVNPALFVVGGTDFRFDWSDAVTAEFAVRVESSIRPALVFKKDTRSDYLNGLCGLAVEQLFPSYRLIDKRS